MLKATRQKSSKAQLRNRIDAAASAVSKNHPAITRAIILAGIDRATDFWYNIFAWSGPEFCFKEEF